MSQALGAISAGVHLACLSLCYVYLVELILSGKNNVDTETKLNDSTNYFSLIELPLCEVKKIYRIGNCYSKNN